MIKLKKIRAEDWIEGINAKYQVIGHEGITLQKENERYHYHMRNGWGAYGYRAVWVARGDMFARARTRRELIWEIESHLEREASR